jgi:hypothetical protein
MNFCNTQNQIEATRISLKKNNRKLLKNLIRIKSYCQDTRLSTLVLISDG